MPGGCDHPGTFPIQINRFRPNTPAPDGVVTSGPCRDRCGVL